MLAGHYAPAYALKRRYPEAPLWQLFLGVQALDVLFFVLAPLGIERVVLTPSLGMPLGMDLQFMPYTHSLAAALMYGGVAWGVGRALGHPRAGLAVGLAIVSHWVADVLVHVQDMPILWGDGPKLGFGIWRWHALGFAFELALLGAAYAWLRPRLHGAAQRAGDVSFLMLCVVQIANDFVLPAPPDVVQLAISGEAVYLVAAWLASRVDRAVA